MSFRSAWFAVSGKLPAVEFELDSEMDSDTESDTYSNLATDSEMGLGIRLDSVKGWDKHSATGLGMESDTNSDSVKEPAEAELCRSKDSFPKLPPL